MPKLVVHTFLTLDGVMQAPGGPEEDPSGGFPHGGWSVNYWDARMGEVMTGWMGTTFDMLLGRKTYEIFAAHWPKNVDHPDEGERQAAALLNSARKHVASRTLERVEWQNSTLIKGDVAEYVRRLKAGSGPEIQVHGSADLIQTLLKSDLIDEFRFFVFPLVLGTGKRLFGGGTVPAALRVTSSETSSTGVIMATYERAGEIPYGSFARPQE